MATFKAASRDNLKKVLKLKHEKRVLEEQLASGGGGSGEAPPTPRDPWTNGPGWMLKSTVHGTML